MSSELDAFVREALGRGIPREQIRATLASAGWRADEIDGALARWAESDFPIPVPQRRPYLSAREAFLYLVLFATLYVVAFNVGSVLFALIEWRWPDAALAAGGRLHLAARARFATASLLTAFPILLFVSRLVARAIARDPEKRGSRIRKWLTYLTLFLAALVMIGDVIALVSAVLSGEMGTRFLLKVAVVFAIAGIVFGHYLGDLRREEAEAPGPAAPGVLARVGAVAALLTIVAGLWFAGSPQQERRRSLDERRIGDLNLLAQAIDAYARENRVLPATLDQVVDFRFSQVRSVRDPETGALYDYIGLDSLRYQLCATFELPDTASTIEYDRGSRFWSHSAGRQCFTITVPRAPRVP
jgi:hypothetical protein